MCSSWIWYPADSVTDFSSQPWTIHSHLGRNIVQLFPLAGSIYFSLPVHISPNACLALPPPSILGPTAKFLSYLARQSSHQLASPTQLSGCAHQFKPNSHSLLAITRTVAPCSVPLHLKISSSPFTVTCSII